MLFSISFSNLLTFPSRVYLSVAGKLGHRLGKLYFLFRSLDIKGKGWITLTYSNLLELVGGSKKTLDRRLNLLEQKGIISLVRLSKEIVQIFYLSIEKTAKLLGLNTLHPVIETSLGDLLANYQSLVVEGAAYYLQNTIENNLKATNPSFISSNELFNRKQGSIYSRFDDCLSLIDTSRSVVYGFSQKSVFVSRNFVRFGVTQQKVAEFLNIITQSSSYCQRKVSKLLLNVEKIRLNIHIGYERDNLHLDILERVKQLPSEIRNRVFCSGKALFLACNNVYQSGVVLKSARYRRRNYFQSLDKNTKQLLIDIKQSRSLDSSYVSNHIDLIQLIGSF